MIEVKAEEFIKEYTRGCSNELISAETVNGKIVAKRTYHEWLTPEQALKAAEIAREEVMQQLMNDAVDAWIFRDITDGNLRISDQEECWNGIRIPEKTIKNSYLICTTDDAIKVKLIIVKED